MTGGRPSFLVDTNVLVYAYDPSDRGKQARAAEMLVAVARAGSGAVSTQVLSEFFVTVTGRIPSPLTADEAERSLTNYARSWRVLDVTAQAVLEAARGVQRHQLSYWDSLIWATAKLNAVGYVVSEDFSDGRLVEGVRFVNPFVRTLPIE